MPRIQPERIGKYRLLASLGKGGMGEVYRARDTLLDREVALKIIAPEMMAVSQARVRFMREARAAARLEHPNIVTIYELGQAGGVPYIVMEMLEGTDLAGLLRNRAKLELGRAVGWLVDVCRALDYAHRRGVIHRDIKPGNIRVLADGTVKLVDFGIARLADSELTRTGDLLGTPAYTAPEVLCGGKADRLSDMWAVGVVLYEVLAGRKPWDGDSYANLVYRVLNESLPALQAPRLGVSPQVAAVARRALARAPGERFRDLGHMGRALEQALAHQHALRAVGERPTVLAAGEQQAVLHHEVFEKRGLASYRELACFGDPPATQQTCLVARRSWLATSGSDGSVRLWDLGARRLTATLRTAMHARTGLEALVIAMASSADGNLLATGHVDGSLRLWHLPRGREVPVTLRHRGAVGALAFSPDGRLLASGGAEASLRLWDVAAALKGEARRELVRQPARIGSLAFSPAGDYLASGQANGVIRLLDPGTRRLLATLRGSQGLVTALASTGSRLVAASQDRALRVFDVAARAERLAVRGSRPASSICLLAEGRMLAAVSGDNALRLIDLERGAELESLVGGSDEVFSGVGALHDGRELVVALGDGRIRLWGVVG